MYIREPLVSISYNDPRRLAVCEQIGAVEKVVASFEAAHHAPKKLFNAEPLYEDIERIKYKIDSALQRPLNAEPFYELVTRIKKAINPVAFAHMANAIGTTQNLILNNAHRFSEHDRKRLLALQHYLDEARLSRAGETMPRMFFDPPPTKPPSQKTAEKVQKVQKVQNAKEIRNVEKVRKAEIQKDVPLRVQGPNLCVTHRAREEELLQWAVDDENLDYYFGEPAYDRSDYFDESETDEEELDRHPQGWELGILHPDFEI